MTNARNRKFSSFTRIAGGWADGILQNESEGAAFSFTDQSVRIKDANTAANNFISRNPWDKLTWTTRGSNAITHDSTGLLCWGPHNLCLQSEDITQAAWTLGTATATSASVLTEATGSASHFIQSNTVLSFVTGTQYRFAMEFKKGNGATAPDWIQISLAATPFGAANYINFNITTLSVGLSDSLTGTIEDVGDGWRRCVVTVTATGTGTGITFGVIFTGNTDAAVRYPIYSGVATSDIQMRKGQCLIHPVVTTAYYQTTSSFYYGPRTDYRPDTLANRGLLLEEARTNLLLYSEDYSNAAWTKIGSTAGTQAALNPMGGVSWKLTEDTNTSSHGVRQIITKAASAITYTFSCWVQGTGRSVIELVAWDEVSNGVTVRFTVSGSGSVLLSSQLTGDFVATVAGDKIVPYPNSWYRVSFSFTTNTATTLAMYIRTFNGTTSYLGDGSSGFRLFGAQLEVNAGSTNTEPYSSYVPTLATAVTRSADTAPSMNSSSLPTVSTGLTLYAKATLKAQTSVQTRIARLEGNSGGDTFEVMLNTTPQARSISLDNTVSQFDVAQSITNYPTPAKAAMSGSDNLFRTGHNGLYQGSAVASTLPVQFTTLRLAFNSGAVTGGVWIEEIIMLPRTMSQTEITNLTT